MSRSYRLQERVRGTGVCQPILLTDYVYVRVLRFLSIDFLRPIENTQSTDLFGECPEW